MTADAKIKTADVPASYLHGVPAGSFRVSRAHNGRNHPLETIPVVATLAEAKTIAADYAAGAAYYLKAVYIERIVEG